MPRWLRRPVEHSVRTYFSFSMKKKASQWQITVEYVGATCKPRGQRHRDCATCALNFENLSTAFVLSAKLMYDAIRLQKKKG